MSLIYLVTHPEKMSQPDPPLTPRGEKQAIALRDCLPKKSPLVLCGTGRRHLVTLRLLNIDAARTEFSDTIGVPHSLLPGGKTVVLACGEHISKAFYTSVQDRADAFRARLTALPDDSIVITSRGNVRSLDGAADPTEAAVYQFDTVTGHLQLVRAASDNIGEGKQEL